MMNSQPNASMEGLREHLMHDPGSLGEFLRKEGYASGFAEMKCQDVIDDIMPVINALLKEAEERAKKTVLDEIAIMESEEPSNYPTNDGQQAVYGVLGLMRHRVESLSITEQSK